MIEKRELSKITSVFTLKMGYAKEQVESVSDFVHMRGLFQGMISKIPPWRIRRVEHISWCLDHSKKFKLFKQTIDTIYLETIKADDDKIFAGLSHLLSCLDTLRDSRYTRSYTFVLARLMGIVSTEPIRSKLPDIVKVQLLNEFAYFITCKALKTNQNDIITPKNYWFALFLHKHAFSFADLCSQYKIVRDNLVIEESSQSTTK
jgi:hypothetical protein